MGRERLTFATSNLGRTMDSRARAILLDQFLQNLFRGTAKAFASDPQAQQVAGVAIERGFDQQVPPRRRMFFYLPFEHAEDLALQQRSVALIGEKDTSGVPGKRTVRWCSSVFVDRFTIRSAVRDTERFYCAR